MYWGLKSRFHDMMDVMKMNPKMLEFHLTDNDVREGNLGEKKFDCDYSIHLPEYWDGNLINPCDVSKQHENIKIYQDCVAKGLSLRNNFNVKDRMKVILHPGGASVEEIKDDKERITLYYHLEPFYGYLNSKQNIELLIENMPPLPWFFGGQYYSNVFVIPDEIIAFCQRNMVGICLDISHLALYCNYAKKNLKEEMIKLLPYTRQIHLADADGTDGEGAAFGTGNVNFKEVIEILKSIDVAVIPETMWGHKDDYFEFKKMIKECNQWLI